MNRSTVCWFSVLDFQNSGSNAWAWVTDPAKEKNTAAVITIAVPRRSANDRFIDPPIITLVPSSSCGEAEYELACHGVKRMDELWRPPRGCSRVSVVVEKVLDTGRTMLLRAP